MTKKIILDKNILNEEEEKYEIVHIHNVNTIKMAFKKKFNYFDDEFVIVERNCYVLVFELKDYDIVGVLNDKEDVNFYLELHNEIQLNETTELNFKI